MVQRIKRALLGSPRDIHDPQTYHRIALVAILAWVGLGADGLSSSAYGPDEAFRELGEHSYLAIILAAATALTVLTISTAYRGIIDRFPYGGGGYVVATQLLGPATGAVSGSALLIDYVLTVSVSIAGCADQIFSVIPLEWHGYKLPLEALIIGILVVLNLRGVKESILILAPIFFLFLVTHAILIFGGIGSHLGEIPRVTSEIHSGFSSGLSTLGFFGLAAIFLRAFSMGAGTFTGIEAVSNGLQIMREPKVETGKRTMLYMSISLSVTAAGILVCYLLFDVRPMEGKTMNAALLERFAAGWQIAGWDIGAKFIVLTLVAEGALLCVAAQAGFIDGPRVMANMALDGWLPRRYSQLSDRLTMQNGVLLIGVAALATLFYTHGNITTLVTMYSINVFVTFSLSMLGMCRYWLRRRREEPRWKGPFGVQLFGLMLCVFILATVIYEKFEKGAWVTLVITALVVVLCFMIRRHYRNVGRQIRGLDKILDGLPAVDAPTAEPLAPQSRTAVMLVGGFSGLGVHQMLQVQRLFPHFFANYVFVSIGVIDAATMKGPEEVENTRARAEESLRKYVALARSLGFPAESRMAMGTEALGESEKICRELKQQYPQSMFFIGKLIFEKEAWFHRFLHNETSYQLQRRLHMAGLDAIVLTVRIMDKKETRFSI